MYLVTFKEPYIFGWKDNYGDFEDKDSMIEFLENPPYPLKDIKIWEESKIKVGMVVLDGSDKKDGSKKRAIKI